MNPAQPRYSLQQLEDLIKQREQGQNALDELASQQAVNQPMRNQGQSMGSMITGRGADPDQQRAMSTLWRTILSRDKTKETGIAAASRGMEKGRQLMDEIRSKTKEEKAAAMMSDLEGQDKNIDMLTGLYNKEQAEIKERERLAKIKRTEERQRQRDAALDKHNAASLEADQIRRQQDISVNTERQYREFWDAKNEYTGQATEYEMLADQFEQADYSGGIPTRVSEFMKELTGDEDKQTAMLKAGRAVAITQAITNLPPGPATDKDIELVLQPQPSQFANPKYLAEYLRARANLAKLNAEYNQFVLTYMDNNTAAGNKMVGVDSAWRAHKIPVGAKQLLMSDPSLRRNFDAKYGKGMAALVLGNE